MALTGWPLLWTLILLTAGAFVVVVWVLSRPWASRGSLRAALLRAGMIIGVNLLVLLTAGVILNDQFTFFADWTDLRGSLGGATHYEAARAGGAPGEAAQAPVPGRKAGPGIGQGAGAGQLPGVHPGERIVRYTVTGTDSGVRGAVVVGLPKDYDAKANAGRRYPVIEAFSGYPGSPAQWFDTMNIDSVIDTLADQRRMSQAIVVSATTESPPGVDTECVNAVGDRPQMETWLTIDVPRWIAQHLRIRTDRASWTTIGLSAGGWCAAMATMLHPEQYASGIVLAGYFAPDFSGGLKSAFGDDTAAAERYDLVALARRRPPPVALWIQTSHSDPLSYPSSTRLINAARRPLSVTSVVLDHAGHRISIWQGLLPTALGWLGENIPGFRPTP